MVFQGVKKVEPHGINCKHWRDIRDSLHTTRSHSCACQKSKSDLHTGAVSRSHFESHSSSHMGILGSRSSRNHQDLFMSPGAGPTQTFDNDYPFHCRTNSTGAEEQEQISSWQPAEAARQHTGHHVRFSFISECDQLEANNIGQEQKLAKARKVTDGKKKGNWHLPYLQQNVEKENKTSTSDQSSAQSRHLTGVDRVCGQTSMCPVHKQECQNCFMPKPILKRTQCHAENDDTSEGFASVHEMFVPQRQTNWLRTIRLLEKNDEKQELLAQLQETQQPMEETQEPEDCKPEKQLIEAPPHQEQENKQECKQSQQKQQDKPQSHQDPGNKQDKALSQKDPGNQQDKALSQKDPGNQRDKSRSHQDPGNQQDKALSHQDPGNQQDKSWSHQDPGNQQNKALSQKDPGNQRDKSRSHQDPGNQQIKPRSHQDPRNQRDKSQTHPEHDNECKLCSQLKQNKRNHRSVSAHNVKTAKPTSAEESHLGRKDIAVGHVRKRERKHGPKPAGCSANILVCDSESGALSAKLLMNPNHRDKMFRKFPRSLSHGCQQ